MRGHRIPWWLWFSLPIGLLGMAGSTAGIFVDRVYAHETSEWAGEAVGQDITNLAVFPLLLLFAVLAARGSLTGLLVWTGMLLYSAYAYAIYVFAVHFGPLFLVDVAVFGLSVWALGGALVAIDADRVRDVFRGAERTRLAEVLLLGLAGMFALLWLSEDLPAVITGSAPDSLARSGLMTNPVHVLDLSLFLPTAVLAGWSLHRRRAWGYVLAPVVLTAMAAIGAGIVSLTIVLAVRGEDASLAVAALIAALSALEAIAVWRLLRRAGRERRPEPGGLPAGLGPLLVDVGAHGDAATGAQEPRAGA